MALSLLATKLYIPPARANAIARPRLTEKLLMGLRQPGSFALLSGPAGFGKTTLLSEFAAALQHPVAWVSLDVGDDEPIRFWSYLIAACQSVQAGVGESALALFRSPLPLPVEAAPAILINDLAGLDRDLVLVLDDFHTIQDRAVHTAFSFLLEHLPARLRVVISTRVDPPWPLARFRARNQLVEVRAQDLRFTTAEAASFLNQMMGLDLAAQDVEALEERTEGWVAGLQLAALSMKGRSDITGFVKAFTGSHIFIAEYLVEEVLQRQPEDIQAFLLQTSLLERLNAGLCQAVTGCADGQSVLLALHRANLFVVPLDDQGQWFRYHRLFADLLQAHLRQKYTAGEISALHRRAAAWYEQAGMTSEAVEHALAAADYPLVIRLVEKVALPMILQAYVRTVDGWLRAIPAEFAQQSPRINMAFAWINLLRGMGPQAAPYLERLRGIFSTAQAGSLDSSLQGEWLAIQSEVLNREGRPAESRDMANRALQVLPEEDALVRSMVYVNLATAYEHMLDYEHAADTFKLIVRDAQAAGDYVSEILGISGRARMLLVQGRLHLGYETASEGLQRIEITGRSTPFSATLYGELGQIHYHWHHLDLAQSYLQRSILASGQSGYSDPELFNNVMHSRMFQMMGDWDAAQAEMQKAASLARAIPPAMVREEIISQQVRVDLAFERLAAAQALLAAEGFTFDGELGFPQLVPGSNVTHQVGLLYNSALRILLYLARTHRDLAHLERGIELAGRVLAGELQCHHLPSALETLLLRSQLYAVLGREVECLADVSQALELAAPEGFVSIFVEEGAPIAEALAILRERGLPGTVPAGYVEEVLSAFPGGKDLRGLPDLWGLKDLPEPLTGRELEVLHLIAAGDSNRAIAEKLVISVSAVKKHTGNIFGKLGVSSRTQAVARARELKLQGE